MRRLLHRTLRGIYRRLLPRGAQSTLRLWLLFERRNRPPARIERFAERSVLVLAPHMDDEVIGCGGALRRHVLAGAATTVVFLTDGAAAGRELAGVRAAESRAAAEVLGLGELVFLDEPDGALAASDALAQTLAQVLVRTRAELVYLPSLFDAHDDHWATNLAFYDSLALIDEVQAPRLRQYEVWTPLLVNAVVDVGSVFDDKLRALEQFASQRPVTDIVRLATGLNQYRSVYHGGGRGYAEAFFESTVPEYRALLEQFRERR